MTGHCHANLAAAAAVLLLPRARPLIAARFAEHKSPGRAQRDLLLGGTTSLTSCSCALRIDFVRASAGDASLGCGALTGTIRNRFQGLLGYRSCDEVRCAQVNFSRVLMLMWRIVGMICRRAYADFVKGVLAVWLTVTFARSSK